MNNLNELCALRLEYRKMRDEAERLETAYCCAFDDAEELFEQWLIASSRADELREQCSALTKEIAMLREKPRLNPRMMFASINT